MSPKTSVADPVNPRPKLSRVYPMVGRATYSGWKLTLYGLNTKSEVSGGAIFTESSSRAMETGSGAFSESGRAGNESDRRKPLFVR